MKQIILVFIIFIWALDVDAQKDWDVRLDKNLTWIGLIQEYMGDDMTYLGTRFFSAQNHVLLLKNNSIATKNNYLEATLYQANMTEYSKGNTALAELIVLCDCDNFRFKITHLYILQTNFGSATGDDWADGVGDSMGSRILESVCNHYNNNEYVSLIRENGVFKLPVTINNSTTSYFIFDTGASDLLISPNLKAKLISNNSLSEQRDFLRRANYMDANGDIETCNVYSLKSVKVGNREIANVTCAVANNEITDMLLGQSFISKLGQFEINFSTKRLIFR